MGGAVQLLEEIQGVTAMEGEGISEKSSKAFEKLLKSGVLRRGDDPKFNLSFIQTGLARLDDMLNGGFIRGRMYLSVGEPSSGKSFLALRVVKEAVDKGLTVAIVDTEHSYDQAWIKRQGIDPSALLISQTNDGEEVIDTVTTLLEAGIDLVVVDSLALMVPRVEIADSAADQHMMLFPKMINLAVRKWAAANSNSVLLLVNHIRDMENIPGGKSQSHLAHAILRVKRAGWIQDGRDKTIGYNMRVTLRKSKQSIPWTKMEIPFTYSGMLDELGAEIDFALEMLPDVVKRGGPWLTYKGQKFLGRSKFVEFLATNPDEHAELMAQLKNIELPQTENDDEDSGA